MRIKTDLKFRTGSMFLTLAAGVVAFTLSAIPTRAVAAVTLWTTNPNMPTLFSSGQIGPSVQTPQTNKEVADDFNVIGVIEQVIADGDDCPGCFSDQPVTGVYVRFYGWTASGPGALQSEQFLAANDPNFNWTPGSGPEFLQITLPDPFQATGWHYVSVQVTFSAQSSSTGKWNFHPVNWGATMGEGVKIRDNNAGGTWAPFPGNTRDASFKLVGTPGAAPPMSILTATSEPITPSARLRITGDGFGDEPGNGQVLINGVASFVTMWSNSVVVAYVPEQTALGNAQLTVVNDAGESDTLSIHVLPREAGGPVQWRFAVDADIIMHRVGLGPDGSIYINEYNNGRLYKLSPNGGLVWIVDALRGQVGSGGVGPVVVGEDGTVYVAVNPLGPTVDLLAYNPDGTLKWHFTNPSSIGVAAGPSIGPDGNIYIVFNDYQPALGAVSFAPNAGSNGGPATPRWSNPGQPFTNVHAAVGTEIAFSSSSLGGPTDQIVVGIHGDSNVYLHAFAMVNGQERWVTTGVFSNSPLMQLQWEAAAGPNGSVYAFESGIGNTAYALQSYNPANGSRSWYFNPGILSEVSPPTVGSDGVIYFGWDLARITAVSPQGQHIWTYDGGSGGVRRMPAISPNNEVVLFGGGPFGQSGYIKALDAQNGKPLFQVDLQTSAGTIFPVDRPAFTPDSATAYVPTGIVNNPGNPHAYVYAIAIGDGGPSAVTAVSRKTHGQAGSFDVDLPLTGEPGVECRSSGGMHTLVFTFDVNVVSGSAVLQSGIGTLAGAPVFSGKSMTVQLSEVADVQTISVALSNLAAADGGVLPSATVNLHLLAGDTTGNKSVNASDVGATKSQAGQPVTAANFRTDVTVNGSINASDVGLVKSRAGQTLASGK